jgi:hypothetical protein
MTQKCPKSFRKKLAYGKVPPKFQNSKIPGGGGVRPGLENTQIKAAFFLGRPLVKSFFCEKTKHYKPSN